ncbi:hypothetical protein EVAR_28621_1 [Eumeta japonica]|uniref:Uncharacterized protein n=1 Tax=Eumeta variegata TaxID=151549 RepID=A0A4C1XVV5_EUMVA|nr:hypothetical protein EVAR_28621_1 [Eumeta japonica]
MQAAADAPHLRCQLAFGYDRDSSEMLRGSGGIVASLLYRLFNKCWKSHRVPNDWCKAVIVLLCKEKGSRQWCNYLKRDRTNVTDDLHEERLSKAPIEEDISAVQLMIKDRFQNRAKIEIDSETGIETESGTRIEIEPEPGLKARSRLKRKSLYTKDEEIHSTYTSAVQPRTKANGERGRCPGAESECTEPCGVHLPRGRSRGTKLWTTGDYSTPTSIPFNRKLITSIVTNRVSDDRVSELQ